MRKTVLRDFIEKLKPREEIYKIGQISSAHEQKVTRFVPTLLPHICEINLIELAWAKHKTLVTTKNILIYTYISRLLKLMSEGSQRISAVERGGYCGHVEKLAKGIWETDGLIEARMEQ
jgi:hypothetical protein